MADMTREEMRVVIESSPLPCEGVSPYEQDDLPKGMEDGGAYSLTANILAHALLLLCEDDPSLLDVPDRDSDPSGYEAACNDKLWQAFEQRWPKGSDWLGGPTGFQFGWAHNTVRWILDVETVGNPAIITIG